MTNPTQDVATVQPSTVDVPDWWDGPDFDEIEGYDLVKDKALFSLVGVPFAATKIIYRDGVQQKGCDWRNDYASVELRVAPQRVLDAQRDRILSRRTGKLITDPGAIPYGEEYLVINCGSTGDYRQILQYLEAKGLVVLPDDLPEQGEKNACKYDLPRSQWIDGASVRFTPSGDEVWFAEFDLAGLGHPMKCPRGLRYSDYENEYTANGERAVTWYIA